MKRELEKKYKKILIHELVPALGCTEPGAIAYAAFKARELLEILPEHIDITCSGNVIKNVKGVVVPNSNGLRGIEAAAILGVMVDADCRELEILSCVKDEDIDRTKALMGTGYCNCYLEKGEGNLYIRIVAKASDDEAEVILKGHHTNIVYLRKNSEILLNNNNNVHKDLIEEYKQALNVKDIVEFADSTDYSDIKNILSAQIQYNTDIAKEGMTNEYGASVGRTLIKVDGSGIKTRAKAMTAAASDARMGGCSLPVVVNSGSGNQGITVTVPVVEYAAEIGVSEEKLYRALILSNLIAIHIKRRIGVLSAFCGAVSAGCASGAAITYLYGGDYEMICSTIINTLGNISGIVCDGAKSSCAAKIASSVDAAVLAHDMTMHKKMFKYGEGLVVKDIEKTISNIGHVGREGMEETDIEILTLMLEDENKSRSA